MNNKETYLYNPVRKRDDAIKVWLSFPFTYKIGMSSLGFLAMYKLLDEDEKSDPERIFTDTTLTKHKKNAVDLFGFSFSFEFDFLKIFEILQKYNIPLSSNERDESYPLIFGGGPVLTANPEPYSEMFDFIIVGDGEEILQKVTSTVYEFKNKINKEDLLKKLALIKGIYVPSLFEPEYNEDLRIKSIKYFDRSIDKTIKKNTLQKLSKCTYSPIVTTDSYFSGSMLVEISRGCPQKCSFCIASYLNLPTRFPLLEEVKKAIDIGIKTTKKVGLLGALIAAHPDFESICEYIHKRRQNEEFEISIASLRADTITQFIVQTVVSCGQQSATIAIEAGSEKLRKAINKNLSNEQIFNAIRIMRENGLKAVKIYGMIGLPNETDDDIDELIELMNIIKKQNPNFKITLSISSFVPKAHTPFQYFGREESKTLDKKNKKLKKELHKLGIKFKPTSIKWDYTQAILSRGDRRLFPMLKKVYEFGGSLGSWNRAHKELKKESIPPFEWYAIRNISINENLPWNHIDCREE